MNYRKNKRSIALTCFTASCLTLVPLSSASAEQQNHPNQAFDRTGQVVMGNYGDAINNLGLTSFSTIYTGGFENPDGSVNVYYGPGDPTALEAAIAAIPLPGISGIVNGVRPGVSFRQVDASISTLNSVADKLIAAVPQYTSDGYQPSSWAPNPETGTLDINLAFTPAGGIDVANQYFKSELSSLARVVSAGNGVPLKFGSAAGLDRGNDQAPFLASDNISYSANGQDCTAGFAITFPDGTSGALTKGHCDQRNLFYNGSNLWGYTVKSLFGNENDIQDVDGTSYGPYVWVTNNGTDGSTAQPYAYPQGGRFTNFPMAPQPLTFDGYVSKMVRYVQVQSSGAKNCPNYGNGIITCNMITFGTTNGNSTAPVAGPGDSGGPVFCFQCYPNVLTPAGDIDGGDMFHTYATFVGTDVNLLDVQLQIASS